MSLDTGSKSHHVSRDFLFAGVAAIAAFVTAISCAPGGSKKKSVSDKVVTECLVQENQQFSLQGHWTTTPIKISLKSGDWEASEISALQEGANTWNKFFEKSKGFAIFDAGVPGAGNQSLSNQNSPSCSSGTLSDGTVIYKRFANWTKSATAIAVTTTCFSTSSNSLARIFNAIMEFNYVNFFTEASGRFPDIQSIATHELGHLIGLDHSCGPLGKPNANKPNVACPDANANPDDPLVRAMMFRVVPFDSDTGAGEVKRELTENDQGRANCLYQ